MNAQKTKFAFWCYLKVNTTLGGGGGKVGEWGWGREEGRGSGKIRKWEIQILLKQVRLLGLLFCMWMAIKSAYSKGDKGNLGVSSAVTDQKYVLEIFTFPDT